jgi:hypothetical protein
VTALGVTNWLAVPPPVRMAALTLTFEADIEAGTVVLVLKVTVTESPTDSAEAAPEAKIVYWVVALAVDEARVTVGATWLPPTSALSLDAPNPSLPENRPRASIVAITPIASIRASPKEVPILVFIYL